jgi:dihydroxyacetone kinase
MGMATRAACEAIISAEHRLNELDTIVGDGDCGTTLSVAAKGFFLIFNYRRKFVS